MNEIIVNKTIDLFEYLSELSQAKNTIVTNVKNYDWMTFLDDLRGREEYIYCANSEDYLADETTENNDIIIRLTNPFFDPCPEPADNIRALLKPGWENFLNRVELLNEEEKVTATAKEALEKWLQSREKWQLKQEQKQEARKIYALFYQLHLTLERDADGLELVLGNGIFRDKENKEIIHPLLIHEVKTEFDPDNSVIYVKNIDKDSDFYNELFKDCIDINRGAIKTALDTLKEVDIHPMDKKGTGDFLKVFLSSLSTDSHFFEEQPEIFVNERFYTYLKPVLFMRKKPDGTVKTINGIVEDLKEKKEVPAHISTLVSGGKVEVPVIKEKQNIDEILAETSGEDFNIYLSKEANKEQLEIAQKIAKYSGVLVQGPPGTGKTHTIANLLGHFLAQGKSVLVTSHTTKALSVLKDKVVPEIQPLCVSVIGDTNKELERSVDGITDFMGRNNSASLKKDMDRLALQRKNVIEQLAETRKNIFAIMQDENKSIVVGGEALSLSEMARYAYDNCEALSYIPGPVEAFKEIPLTSEELKQLYASNGTITKYDEMELNYELPLEEELVEPDTIKKLWSNIAEEQEKLAEIEKTKGWKLKRTGDASLEIVGEYETLIIGSMETIAASGLRDKLAKLEKLEAWMKQIVVDGQQGELQKEKWERLIKVVKECKEFSDSFSMKKLGKEIDCAGLDITKYEKTLIKLKNIFAKSGKVGFFDKLLDSSLKQVLGSVKINNKEIASQSDCDLLLDELVLQEKRNSIRIYWEQLVEPLGLKRYIELQKYSPESEAILFAREIERLLTWYEDNLIPIIECAEKCEVPLEKIFNHGLMDSALVKLEKTLNGLKKIVVYIYDACCSEIRLEELLKKNEEYQEIYSQETRGYSIQCRKAAFALSEGDLESYSSIHRQLKLLSSKKAVLRLRCSLLEKLSLVAPGWERAIKERKEIHGLTEVPVSIIEAWKWRQYSTIVAQYTKTPFDELQDRCSKLSKEYRRLTAQYAAKSAWCHLLVCTEGDLDLMQALQGWKANIKKLGKGTGKLAYKYRREAKKRMAECQRAVPAWIMPVNKALEMLDPKENKFDIIIIDEASQSDVTALAVLYMGKKVIVVGDDKQVSPMAVGMNKEKMSALIEDRLSGIPNANLYTADTSLYSIAMTTYQPLMLKEHFRCVPEIIGFSNMLSYDYKIKPLRDVSDCQLLPYVVSYRVADGTRLKERNINIEEAKSIVALIGACIERPEYEGKTFGVISLLGDEQGDYISQLLATKLGAEVISKRKIICGKASHFQGDERDVIFISLIDSNENEGPMRILSDGYDEAAKKRYNVAMSRAKDQVWIVHSLDKDNDLKPGDLRKTLLDYAENPRGYIELGQAVEKYAESPFEESVGKALVSRGYHIEQQVEVGSYRIDMVAYYGEKRIAIECDGDRYHSGTEKIIEDMERQTILERLGWRFIRIRGSEYYRNPDATLQRVTKLLEEYGILPETLEIAGETVSTGELLSSVKTRAEVILQEMGEVPTPKSTNKWWAKYKDNPKSDK